MKIRRKLLIATLPALVSLGFTSPAGAASRSLSDPAGDVSDGSSTVAEPRVDITNVELTNDLDQVKVTITVSQTVPFSDPLWESGDLGVVALLSDPSSSQDGGWLWSVFAFEGEAAGFLSGDVYGCTTEATQTATAYVLTADARCARGLPRSLEYGAVALMPGSSPDSFVVDGAPDAEHLAAAVEAAEHGLVNRIAGTDRILTAIELSRSAFGDGEAGAVVLAASQSFPDALAGGPLAYVKGAPMLLTGQAGLDPRVKTEMARVLEPGGDVFVLGGTAALSDKVLSDVQAAGFSPKRVAGINRFETAIAIAVEVDSGDLTHDEVLIADGRTFTDALIAGAVAPSVAGVVVLTDGATMPKATSDYLGVDETLHVAIGTPASQAATGVRRITGADPSQLSANVAEELGGIQGIVAVASQATFADALAGGPFIASYGGPLLLTDPKALSAPTRDAITSAAGSLREVVVFGGTAAVSAAAVDAITAALASG